MECCKPLLFGAAALLTTGLYCQRLKAKEPRGFPLLPGLTTVETLAKCKNLAVRPTDVFVCSYPKSGTTWTQNIVVSLLRAGREEKCPIGHISDYAPFFEIDPHWQANGNFADKFEANHANLGRRVFNTHLRWEMMPKRGQNGQPVCAKYIYVVRNGKDVITSFFHHLSNQVEGGFEGTFQEFLDQWTNGEIPFGKWSDHLKSWLGWQDIPGAGMSALVISYEDMVRDLRPVVDKIVRYCEIDITPSQVDALMPSFDFKNMKKNKNKFQPISVGWKKGYDFLRKGKSGDNKQLFSEEHQAQFTTWLAKEFPTGLPPFLWTILA